MSKPLEGIRILDFTWAQQGPYATTLMADMGAEIIKIEAPGGERGRHIFPPGEADAYPLGYFVAHNRGS
jgi:crotonobetainyl-CoA:carnitine CoA-transferase CaiB-like acyl-CoA transferase